MKQEPQALKDQVYSREQYATANFWDQRYSEKGGMFDWYAQYPELKNSFSQYDLKLTDKILMVGCGNSKLSIQMWQAGYKNIINIDISPTVIQQMKNQFPQMIWEVMDATKMSYSDGQFDVIIDKGTLDALISGKNYDICQGLLRECMRVTKQNGQVLLITYGSPQGRRKVFEPVYPFDKYDYYQCRAELNDVSTMINLMRSNVGENGLNHIIKDQAAFAKSMKEYSLIRFLRQKRINKKQFILWSYIQNKGLEVNPSFENLPKQLDKKQKQKQQISKPEEKRQESPISKQSQPPAKKVTYDPKKQSYVWVYSIRRKFASDIDTIVDEKQTKMLKQIYEVKNQQCTVQGKGEFPAITFYLRQDYMEYALKGVHYLSQKQETFPSCKFTQHCDRDYQNSLRINLISLGPDIKKMMVLRKTNYTVTVQLDERNTAMAVMNYLNKILKQVIGICDLYPCPKTYALFSVIKNRMVGVTINDLLDKYWFPTYKVSSLDDRSLTIKISLPPICKQQQEEIINTISKLYKRSKLTFQNGQKGCISYFDLTLSNIVSMASLCYTNSKLDLVLEQFWEKDGLYDNFNQPRFIKSEKYSEIPNTIAFPKQTIPRLIAHILTFS